jgi:tetratricopeptide (TPR) repeat protein
MTYYNLAVEYFNDAKYADCKIQMEGAVGLNNKIAAYFSLKGKAEYYLGQYDEAYQDFKRSLELNPNDKDLQLRMMQFEKEKGWDDTEGLSAAQQPEVSLTVPAGGKTKKTAPAKVKVQPSAISITSDPLGLCDDFSKIATREDLDAPLELSFCTSLLPTLNPYMAAPMLASELCKKKKQHVKEVTHCRTIMKRGPLWKVVENISAQADKQRQPLSKSVAKKPQDSKKPPMSAVALKRLSAEISREAAKHPLLQGIKSSHDDPMLTALKNKLKGKSSILSQDSLVRGDPVLMKSVSLPRVRVVSRSRGSDAPVKSSMGEAPSTKNDRFTAQSR